MATTPRMIFVNLSVQDLPRSMEFFRGLGFEFDPRFTDDKGACMILSDKGFVMLLSRPFFETFTKRKVCDTATHTETMLALSCESRGEVDELVRKAIEGGGSPAMDKMDHGFMYGWSFYDPDGHHWEVVWMDPKAMTEGPQEQKS